VSEVKIEHFENDIQDCTFIFTSSDGDQQIAWEGEADYLAIKQLQATIAEMGNVIGNDQAQIKFYRDAVADKEDEVARLLAVESNANDLYIALDWVLKDYEGMCRKSFPPSANWKKRLVTAKAALRFYKPAINPIGDKP